MSRFGWLAIMGVAVTLSAAPTTLRIGVDRKSPPLAFVDEAGQPTGFSVELLREMERSSGVRIEIVPGYWKDNFARFDAGELDGLANVIRTPDNEEEFDLSIGHGSIHGVVYRRPDRPSLRHTRDFAGKVIATVRGTAANADALRRQEWGATIRTLPTLTDVFDAVRRGDCDAALFTNRVAFSAAQERGLTREFVDDLTYRFHFAVRKGNRAKLALLNQALATTMENRSFDRIYSKWIGPIEPRPIPLADLRPYLLPVSAGLLVLVGIFVWQRHMLRRLAQQAEQLRQSEERWKFALEGSGAAVWDWDIAAGQIHYSPHWKELLGLAADEISTRPDDADQWVHPDDRAKVAAARTAHWQDPAVPFAIEYRLRHRDGSWKWIMDRGMVVRRDPAGKPLRMIGTGMDLTARRQAEADRLVLGKLESTGILAGGLAHDFNNLLTVISLNLELARITGASGEELRAHLQDIEAATKAAGKLTQQLITFAQGGNSVRQPVALTTLLREEAQVALRGSEIKCEFRLPADVWLVVGDGPQISQVFRNLLLNAREATVGAGAIAVRADNATLAAEEVRTLPAGDYVRVSVIDHGSGMAPEMLPRIFDPYFSTKERGVQRGMGLGLTICHSIVAKHGGTIVVESTPGSGSTFHVYLPACRDATAGAVAPPPAASVGLAGRRILVMDDEEALRMTVGHALRRMGCLVELVPDGGAAVAAYSRARAEGQPFAVVLLDLSVREGMGGLEAMQQLQSSDPEVKAIVMSGYSQNAVLLEYQRHGFKGALAKPFTSSALSEALTRALGAVPASG